MPGVRCLWHDEDALTTVEYALLMAILVVGALGAFQYLGRRIEGTAWRANYALRRTSQGRTLWWLAD